MKHSWLAVTTVASVLIVLAIAITCINAVCFDASYYKEEYAKLGTAEYVGVSEPELFAATDILLGYLKGSPSTLDLPVHANGGQEEYYSEREKQHMVDVRKLYQGAIVVMILCYAVGIVMLLACILVNRKQSFPYVMRGLFWGTLALLVGFGLLAAYVATDFNRFWVQFHELFFTNDLWILDPAVSRMIRMFETQFFFDMVTRILAVFIGIVTGILIASGIAYKTYQKKQRIAAA